MNKATNRLLVVLATFIVGFSGAPNAGADAVADGARLYNENCGRCHNPRPVQELSEQEWSVVMPHMREKAHLSGQETRAIEAFIAVTFTAGKTVALPTPLDVDGKALVARYACAGCHRISGAGGTVGPDLSGVVSRLGVDSVVRKLLEPTFNNPASAMPKFPLNADQAAAIAKELSD